MQKHYAFANDEKIRLSLKAVECINLAIDLFRQKGLPIICIQHSEGDIVPGKEGFNNIDQLNLTDNDIHIVKTYGKAQG